MSDSFETPWTVARQAPLVHEISQARILEGVVMSFYRGFSQPRGQIQEPASPVLPVDSLPLSHLGGPSHYIACTKCSPFCSS